MFVNVEDDIERGMRALNSDVNIVNQSHLADALKGKKLFLLINYLPKSISRIE